MADILHMLDGTFASEPPETTLKKAKKWGMERCMIIGLDDDGQLIFGGSFSEVPEMIFLLEIAKQFILENRMVTRI